MDQFCGSKFWDGDLAWNTKNPDFTNCFKNTVLVWIPCGFLWIFSPYEIYCIRKSTSKRLPSGVLFATKLGFTLSLILLAVLEFGGVLYATHHRTVYDVEYTTPFLKTVSFVSMGRITLSIANLLIFQQFLAALLLTFDKKRGLQKSGVLFLFWFLLALCEIPKFRSLLEEFHAQNKLTLDHASNVIYYPVICVLLVLNFFADAKPKHWKHSQGERPCPRASSSFPANILFTWFDPLAWKGFKTTLTETDLWSMNPKDTANAIVTRFQKQWNKSLQAFASKLAVETSSDKTAADVKSNASKKKMVSILPSICRMFGTTILYGGLLNLVSDTLIFARPQILKLLIAFTSGNEESWKGYLYVVLLLCAKTIDMLFLAQSNDCMFVVALRIRTLLTTAIYRKALRLSNAARRESTIGEIVNLMTVDAHSIMEVFTYIHILWTAPLQIIIAFYFLWNILGPALLAGCALMLVVFPLNLAVMNKVLKLQLGKMKKKDERVKMMNEILNGMKVLKMYGWESSFEKQVSTIRNVELGYSWKANLYYTGLYFIWNCSPMLICLVSLMTYVMIDETHVLDAEKVFVSLALLNLIQVPVVTLPEMIARVTQGFVSMKRIDEFMNSEELSSKNVEHAQSELFPMIIENGSFAWGDDSGTKPTLRDINFHVRDGELVAIVGAVAAGKSSLLSALLGEMDRLSGRVNTKGTIAYVSQQAWIQNASVRDNILFGSPLNEELYRRVVEVCALRQDLEILPAGDRTEIGEKGVNLSGGQKQRISLARAVYNGADVYLFDDPLSAVDAHVGKHIFDNVMGPRGMLKNKTRVLVTHGISYLPQVDDIFVLKNGEILEHGTYNELLEKRGVFAEIMLQNLEQVDVDATNEADDLGKMKQQIESTLDVEESRKMLSSANSSGRRKTSETRGVFTDSLRRRNSTRERISIRLRNLTEAEDKDAMKYQVGEKCIEAEKSEIGSVTWSVYFHYLRAASCFLMITTIVSKAIGQALGVSANMLLSIWISDNTTLIDGIPDTAKRDMYLTLYGLLSLGQATMVLISLILLTLGNVRGSRTMHAKLLHTIFRAPVAFFEVTPLGRILNRFGRDVNVVDHDLPIAMKLWIVAFGGLLSTIVVICYTTPLFVTVVIPMSIIYHVLQRFYIASCRQLKRLESVTSSPIYSHFSESMAGAQTIRAYGAQARFIEESESKIDVNQRCTYVAIIADRWLTVRLESIGNLIVFFAALFAVLQKDTLSASLVGLSVTYALQITDYLALLVVSVSDVESNIVSVERIKEYSEKQHEAPWEIAGHTPDKEWPSEGRVEFRDYKTRYRAELDLILHGLSFTVLGGERIGIVGRTGAGKSSLTLALFRIIEPASGQILVDGVDISKIGLQSLRSRLTIIPQEPVLFSGTLRMNLDPFDVHTDEEVWRALGYAHLRSYVAGLKGGLMYVITEGGDNLSVGQRQLVCLARALLRKTKVLILDEATASVDMETDDFIQRTIRKEFEGCTVLTIAHRLNTIMDSDKVIVLDKGCIAEFDPPETLLQKKTSVFYAMARDAGLVK